MEKKLWFKAKRYGWGWYPASWEGWLVIALYAAFLVKTIIRIEDSSLTGMELVISFVFPIAVATGLLIAISYWKGEKPGWRWGDKDK